MIAMLQFATLVIVTVFAVIAAAAIDWMLLRVMFVLMHPATARRRALGTAVSRGTAELAPAFAPQR